MTDDCGELLNSLGLHCFTCRWNSSTYDSNALVNGTNKTWIYNIKQLAFRSFINVLSLNLYATLVTNQFHVETCSSKNIALHFRYNNRGLTIFTITTLCLITFFEILHWFTSSVLVAIVWICQKKAFQIALLFKRRILPHGRDFSALKSTSQVFFLIQLENRKWFHQTIF